MYGVAATTTTSCQWRAALLPQVGRNMRQKTHRPRCRLDRIGGHVVTPSPLQASSRATLLLERDALMARLRAVDFELLDSTEPNQHLRRAGQAARRQLTRLPACCTGEQCVDALRHDGAVVIERLASADLMAAYARDALHLQSTEYSGDENSFAGSRTFRIGPYMLAQSEAARTLAVHPLVLETTRKLLAPVAQKIRLAVASTIRVCDGQPAQVLHRDDEEWPLPLVGTVHDGVEVEVSALWAVTEFRAANGATRVVVGSHGSHSHPAAAKPPSLEQADVATMMVGSVLLWTGSVWHGAGAANGGGDPRGRVSALFQYTAGWLHTEQNLHFAINPSVSSTFTDPELRSLLGFDGTQTLHACF